jgi:hypothetical protein
MSAEARMIDTNPGISENIATDADFHLTFVEDPFFAETLDEYQPPLPEPDLSDDLPDGDALAKTLSGDTRLSAPEPPARVLAMAGFVILGIYGMLRRMLRYCQRQRPSGRRRRVRIYVRKMA